EDDGRLDVAAVIDRVDRRTMPLDVLGARDPVANTGQREAESHADDPGSVERPRPCRQQRQKHHRRADDEDVQRDDDIGREGTDGSDQRHRRIKHEGPATESDRPFENVDASAGVYEARAVRRALTRVVGLAAGLVDLTFCARAAARARVEKQRSSALSTFSSTMSICSPMTDEISEVTRKRARSSMRFSRNERFLDLARNVRLFRTSTTS